MNTLAKLKIHQNAVKAYIFGSGIWFTFYCGALCFGLRHALAEFVGMTFAYVLLCIAAWAYRLCWISWAFLFYSYTIRSCIIVQRLGWFGSYIDVAHIIAFLIGAVISLYFLLNFNRFVYE